MSNVRRWYFYIICAIALQAVTWATIALLRSVLLSALGLGLPDLAARRDTLALQGAVIAVGLPLFLLHWRWATRSEAGRDEDDFLRLLYLTVMLGAFLLPLIFNLRGVLEAGLTLLLGAGRAAARWTTTAGLETLVASLAAIAVLGLLAWYHARLLREERPSAPLPAIPATLHALFLYFFSLLGLALLASGLVDLLHLGWLALAGSGATAPDRVATLNAAAQVLTGLGVWLLFWRKAQRLPNDSRAAGVAPLRQIYLNVVILGALLSFAASAGPLLEGLFRDWLGLFNRGGSGPLVAVLLVAALLGGYHVLVLREDAAASPLSGERTAVQRVFWYILAATGLLATLSGVGGLISVAIRTLFLPGQSAFAGEALRAQLARFLAVLLVGLPLWLVSWRQIQREAAQPPPAGTQARQAPARRVYLYGFILLATLTFLGCAIYLVYQGISSLLGEPLNTGDISDMAQAAAFALMAVVVWLYHGRILREDNEALAAAAPLAGRPPRIVLLEDGDGRFAARMAAALREAFPTAVLATIPLGDRARTALPLPADSPPTAELLRRAHIIIAPWTATTPYAGPPLSLLELGAAFADSPAERLIVPFALPGWEWVGVSGAGLDTAVAQTVQAVGQIVAGQRVRPRAPLGAARLLVLLLGALLLLSFLLLLLGSFLPFTGLD